MTEEELKVEAERQRVRVVRLGHLCLRVQEAEVPVGIMEEFCLLYLECLDSARRLNEETLARTASGVRDVISEIRAQRLDEAKRSIQGIALEVFSGLGVAEAMRDRM